MAGNTDAANGISRISVSAAGQYWTQFRDWDFDMRPTILASRIKREQVARCSVCSTSAGSQWRNGARRH